MSSHDADKYLYDFMYVCTQWVGLQYLVMYVRLACGEVSGEHMPYPLSYPIVWGSRMLHIMSKIPWNALLTSREGNLP